MAGTVSTPGGGGPADAAPAGRRVRVGIDVGGTFTKAAAIDARTGELLSRSVVPTTHAAARGVAEGIVAAMRGILGGSAGIRPSEIEMISHSTTQAINALLESDTATVGVVAMGVGPEKKEIIRRTRLRGAGVNAGGDIRTVHDFLDTSHLLSEQEVSSSVGRLRDGGADVIVAAEAYGVDDPSNEAFVMDVAHKMGVPATASHEISGTYGLEIRTLTAAVNASVLPRTCQVADFVEAAIGEAAVGAPLMIMKGDGGVTSMDTFRTRPVLTVLSGPAASVAGALLHLRVTDGIFVEVGGTSTNICIIRGGRPQVRYATIKDHPTCIRSLDVRILGVGGGSMVRTRKGRVFEVGPRSAHIAGLGYACFAEPRILETGRIVLRKPLDGDAEEYVAIECRGDGGDGTSTYAITNTCAANALGMVGEDDYARGNAESARIAMTLLGGHLGVSYTEVAMSIIQTASFQITRTVTKILKEFKMESLPGTQIIGGGGGASVLIPFAAKQLGMRYEKAHHAEIISSIGVASSMMREEAEISMPSPSPEMMSEAVRSTRAALVEKGAVPESVLVDTEYVADRAVLRVTAVGNVELDGAGTSRTVLTPDEAGRRAAEAIGVAGDAVRLAFETGHYLVFEADVGDGGLLDRVRRKGGRHRRLLVMDRFGRVKVRADGARVIRGERIRVMDEACGILGSYRGEVAPQVHLLDDMRLMDFSGLTSVPHLLDAIRRELGGGAPAPSSSPPPPSPAAAAATEDRAAVIIEAASAV